MASSPNAAPILFDRTLLQVRQSRARKLGPETFLLDIGLVGKGEIIADTVAKFRRI